MSDTLASDANFTIAIRLASYLESSEISDTSCPIAFSPLLYALVLLVKVRKENESTMILRQTLDNKSGQSWLSRQTQISIVQFFRDIEISILNVFRSNFPRSYDVLEQMLRRYIKGKL